MINCKGSNKIIEITLTDPKKQVLIQSFFYMLIDAVRLAYFTYCRKSLKSVF